MRGATFACAALALGLAVSVPNLGDRGSDCTLGASDALPGCIGDVRAGFGEGSFQSGTIAGTTTALRSWPRPLTDPEVREMGRGVLALYAVTRSRYGGPAGAAGECRPTLPNGRWWCVVLDRDGRVVADAPVKRVFEDGSVVVWLPVARGQESTD